MKETGVEYIHLLKIYIQTLFCNFLLICNEWGGISVFNRRLFVVHVSLRCSQVWVCIV